MEILVAAATRMEIDPFLKQDVGTDVLITGVGAPACMYSLTKHLQRKQYDLVIQAGIAGTLRTAFSPGETFAVTSDLFADLGIYERNEFYTLFEKGFARGDELPYNKDVLVNEDAADYGLQTAHAITVNTVTDQFAQTELFLKKYAADVESMEGAAFHYVCLSEKVKFLQLRAVSNFVGERVKTNWKIKESIESLNQHLFRITENFKKVHE